MICEQISFIVVFVENAVYSTSCVVSVGAGMHCSCGRLELLQLFVPAGCDRIGGEGSCVVDVLLSSYR